MAPCGLSCAAGLDFKVWLKFAKTKWMGLKVLMSTAGVKPQKKFNTWFEFVAPELTAGRLEHANVALDLLLEEDLNMATERL